MRCNEIPGVMSWFSDEVSGSLGEDFVVIHCYEFFPYIYMYWTEKFLNYGSILRLLFKINLFCLMAKITIARGISVGNGSLKQMIFFLLSLSRFYRREKGIWKGMCVNPLNHGIFSQSQNMNQHFFLPYFDNQESI